MKNVDKLWFKILTCISLAYVFIGGMIRPLNPGILESTPISAQFDNPFTLKVTTYNCSNAIMPYQAWIKLENGLIGKALSVDQNKEKPYELAIHFLLPRPSNISNTINASLIVYNETEKSFVRPSALSINLDTIAQSISQTILNEFWIKDLPQAFKQTKASGFPFRNILEETIRNIFYHVPLWFAMFILYGVAVFYSILNLRTNDESHAFRSYSLNRIGFFFGILGIITGAVWAKNTWGQYWTGDIKLNMTAISMLTYSAYFILWKSFTDPIVKHRVSSVYSIFAFLLLIPLIFVIPRLYDSLHPGNGGNPALGGEDLDNTMRTVFYPSILAFTFLGMWISNIMFKLYQIEYLLKKT